MFRIVHHLRSNNYFLFELFLFLRLTALFVSAIAISMLIQDKTCLVTYGQNVNFCLNIQNQVLNATEDSIRDKILAETTRFNNYKNLIECLPMFVWSMFVGSFLDQSPNGTSIILALNIVGNVFSLLIHILNMFVYESSPYYMIIASLSITFTGGIISLLTTTYRYITINTEEKSRNLKFVVLEIIYVIGIAIAMYVGGQLLTNRTNIDSANPQLRTYGRNFMVSIIFDLLSALALFGLNKVCNPGLSPIVDTKDLVAELEDDFVFQEVESLLNEQYAEMNNNYDSISTNDRPIVPLKRKLSNRNSGHDSVDQYRVALRQQINLNQNQSLKHFFKSLFNLENARQTIHAFIKSRPYHARLQIFLLFLILFLQVLTTQGMSGVLLQFSEKVYHWDSTTYSTVSAFTQIVSMLLLAVGSALLVKQMKLSDGTLIIISQLSSFCRNILMGTFLSPFAYFLSIIIGSLSGFTVVAARTKISKIVSAEEVGKIFSLSTTMEAIVPMIGSLIYTNIFSVTISFYPGAIYQFSAFIVILSLIVIVFDEYYCPINSISDDGLIQDIREDDPQA
ncbi:hypothetical protein BLOT_008501 [Blomia tropicalis]|nr:hypothetical protein BLOT_008501 [Blomia tropicalis]